MKKIFLTCLFVSSMLFAQETIDKIVAVVDNEIIMKSELDFQVSMLIAQKKANPNNPGLRAQILNSLVEEKLAYAQALIDSINVTEEEVNRQIDYQISVLQQQYGSKEKIEQLYGMSIEKIKRELRDNVKKEQLVQKLQEKKFGQIDASRREVEEFFNKFKDSLGIIPEKVKLYHLFKNPKQSSAVKEKYRKFAQALIDSIKQGADFATLAKKYSEDPGSAIAGGDLGFVKRGVFYPEFEAAAFALDVKQLSGVVESPAGFHIIQLMERRGESIRCRHILVKIKNEDEADLAAIEFLNSVRDSILKGKGSFTDFAKKYSDDAETASFGGIMGTFYLEQMDKPLLEIVGKLKDGEISYPKRVDLAQGAYGYHIVWLEKRITQHKPDIEVDYVDLKRLTDEYKKQKLYSKWMEELKTKIFWEIRL